MSEVLDSFSEDKEIKEIKKSITLKETDKKKLERKYQTVKSKKALTNAVLEEKVEEKQLKQKFIDATRTKLSEVFKNAWAGYVELLSKSFVSTLLFSTIAVALVFVHTIGVGNVLVKLDASPFLAYPFAFFLAGLLEVIMLAYTMDYKHGYAKLAMYSAMLTISLVGFMEWYYKHSSIDVLTSMRLISGVLLVPLVKGLVASARDTLGTKSKKPFEKLNERTQKGLVAIMKNGQRQIKRGKDAVKVNFRAISNANRITSASLRDLAVKYNVYTNKYFKQLPKETRVNPAAIDSQFEKQVVEHILAEHSRGGNVSPKALSLVFADRKLSTRQATRVLMDNTPEVWEQIKPKKKSEKREKVGNENKGGLLSRIFG